MKRIELTCRKCGKAFTRNRKKLRYPLDTFCSFTCAGTTHLKFYGYGRMSEERVCEHCGAKFMPWKGKKVAGRFCSRTCASNSAKSAGNKAYCKNCGKEIEERTPPSWVKRGSVNYCSAECKKQFHNTNSQILPLKTPVNPW